MKGPTGVAAAIVLPVIVAAGVMMAGPAGAGGDAVTPTGRSIAEMDCKQLARFEKDLRKKIKTTATNLEDQDETVGQYVILIRNGNAKASALDAGVSGASDASAKTAAKRAVRDHSRYMKGLERGMKAAIRERVKLEKQDLDLRAQDKQLAAAKRRQGCR